MAAQTHRTEHRVDVAAPAKVAYDIVADTTQWPHTFGPTVHIEVLERTGTGERIRLWATANGVVKTWTSRRELDPGHTTVAFRQEVSQHPVAGMGGEWRIEERADGGSTVRLRHDFQAVDDDPANVEWIHRAVEHNSEAELAALKSAAELTSTRSSLTFTVADEIDIDAPPGLVYEFLYRVQDWPRRLPHVSRLELTEDTPNLQLMEMDTRTADGSVHTTCSARVCFPEHLIVYKQTQVPALMSAHTGSWRLTPSGGGTVVVSTHLVVLNPATIQSVLGPDATEQTAREFVHRALSNNSGTTLRYAKEYAEKGGEPR